MKVKNGLPTFIYALGVCSVKLNENENVRHARLRDINPDFEDYEIVNVCNGDNRTLYRINPFGPDQKVLSLDLTAFKDVSHVASIFMAAYEMHVAENKKET